MAILIDTSLWIDFTRQRSPKPLKQFIAPYILDPGAMLAEPIIFEVLCHATSEESKQLVSQFETFPILSTPEDLWTTATALGQVCRTKGVGVASLDLLIATIAIHHDVTLVTFDKDFSRIAKVSDLRVKCPRRPE